jgi:hypothetical protein
MQFSLEVLLSIIFIYYINTEASFWMVLHWQKYFAKEDPSDTGAEANKCARHRGSRLVP